MTRGGACEVVFGKSPSNGEILGDRPIIGFRGKGEPGQRRMLNRDERKEKRKKNKVRRKARGK